MNKVHTRRVIQNMKQKYCLQHFVWKSGRLVQIQSCIKNRNDFVTII